MKKVFRRTGIVIVILVILGFGAFLAMSRTAENAISSMIYEDINMKQVSDGTYYGETDAGLVSVKVGVTVKNHTISGIEIIKHDNGMGSKAESITQKMITNNDYKVDAISGATLSSETIKSAVSKALKAGCLGK